MGDLGISHSQFETLRRQGFGPLVIDVRRERAYADSEGALPDAIRRDPERIGAWWRRLDLARPIVVYCAHGQELSQQAAAFLAERGYAAHYLAGGFDGWRDAGQPVARKPAKPSRWITRERPKIDRIACPWLIRRFVDRDAEFIYVPASEVLVAAAETGATPYDVPGVAFTHVGEGCSFDTFIEKFELNDPALLEVASVVRGADTDQLELAPPAAGLFAISLGLSANIADDHEMLRYGLVIYDALYRWHRDLRAEAHRWPPVKAA